MKETKFTFQRYEKKYLLSREKYQALWQELEPLVEPDRFFQSTVCSVYYDWEEFRLIRHSLDKPVYKEKLRLRSYGVPDAGSTVGKPIDAEDIHPFAAAMLEGLAAKFMPMDGRFLADKTAYGSASAEKPTGESTVAEYLGYFQDRGDSVFSRHLKVFGMAGDLM